MLNPDPTVTDLVTAVGRLLSNPLLRDRFAESPERVADELGIVSSARDAFVSLDPQQLNRQAETLIDKRWQEVRRLVPRTIAALGEQVDELFRYYATHHWPQGHRRHVIDARTFLDFLAANRIVTPDRNERRTLR